MFYYLFYFIYNLYLFSFLQVVRLKLTNDKRIVGTLIPAACMTTLLKVMSMGAEDAEETIH
jgi:hypothetical protein